MSCKDCFNNCDPSPISDQCVTYTGPGNTILGIVPGVSLRCVEDALLSYLSKLIDGTGISLDITTDCTLLTNLVNSDKSLLSVMQAYASAICSLKASVDALQPAVVSYDVSCLTGVPANPTTADVVKALLSKVCSLSSDVSTIKSDYVKSSELTTRVQTIITQTSQASNPQEYTKMPKYVALPYHGDLSNFDSNGKGIANAGYDKVYLCLGQQVNGFTLPDYRGRGPVGVNVGVPGSAMDSAVDPSQTANAGYQIVLNGKKGEFTHTLSVQETAPHTHGVNDPGHSHYVTVPSRDLKNDHDNGSDHTNDGADHRSFPTDKAFTGISVQSAGGGQPHNNLQPSVGAHFIMYIP